MQIKSIGDKGLVIIFEYKIDIKVNQKVKALKDAIDKKNIKGVIETVMSYNELALYYRPELIRYKNLKLIVEETYSSLKEEIDVNRTGIEVPVVYGGEYGPDLQEVADYEGLTVEEVIKKHTETYGYVYAIGSMPGTPYIGADNETFKIPRRKRPRLSAPARSMVIQTNQTTLLPVDQPTGWNIIGSTPIEIFDAVKENHCTLNPGMWVKFNYITQKEYDEIREAVESGTYRCKTFSY